MKRLIAFLFGAYFRSMLCSVAGTAEKPTSHKYEVLNKINIRKAARQWLLIAVGHVTWNCVKRSMSEKALLPTKRSFCDCCHNLGPFLCGVERVKRFVNIHLYYIVNNLKRMSKMSTLLPPWKNVCGRPCHYFRGYPRGVFPGCCWLLLELVVLPALLWFWYSHILHVFYLRSWYFSIFFPSLLCVYVTCV